MQLAIFLLALLEIIHSHRVKRQWGPSDFYQFEQWVNYVNRPRQPQFSVDNARWGTPQYPAGNRNIQPHSAPNGWNLEQNPYWMSGYRPMPGYPQTRSRPPVVIETNVFRTNSRVPVPFSPPSGYGIPPHLMGARGFQPPPSTRATPTTTSTTTTTTTTPTTTTTEDESERFIQTAVKEDIDNVAMVSPTTEEVFSTTETATTTKKEQVDVEASMNTRSTILEITTTTTQETTTTTPVETTTTEFSSFDYNSVWSEGEPLTSTLIAPVPSTSADKPDTAVTEPEASTQQQESSGTPKPMAGTITEVSTTSAILQISTHAKNIIPEAEESPDSESFVTGTLASATSTTVDPSISNSFQADLGLRPPPLPIDVLKRFHELGVSIEPSRF